MEQAQRAENVVAIRQPAHGFIDYHGYHAGAGSWVLGGWCAAAWPPETPARVTLRFEGGEAGSPCLAAFFFRGDIPAGAAGAVLVAPAAPVARGALVSATVEVGGRTLRLLPANPEPALPEAELRDRALRQLALADPDPARGELKAWLDRRPYEGADTLGRMSDFVRVGLDHAFVLPPDGLALAGWIVAAPGAVRCLRLRSGDCSTPIDLARAVAVERGDVAEAFADRGAGRRCGFVAALAGALVAHAPTWLEVESWRGETGHLPVPAPRRHGLAAIKALLELAEPRGSAIAPAFEHVFGPAVEALNRRRLAAPPQVAVRDFGPPPRAPECSVLVPLYGRIDLLEAQLALFPRAAFAGHELVYVLDDPERREETEALAASAYARFGTPFRLALLDRSVGYGPANNVALGLARGPFACLLNSDVFPCEDAPVPDDWLARLCAHLRADPALGACGPMLLFEDGSVQHRGIAFETLADHGGWSFPRHPGKGRRPGAATGLARAEAITGACLVARTAQLRAMGGFDEAYAVGDFEDADLCRRLGAAGFRCAVDLDLRLLHLERRSQAAPTEAWRRNLTLYNAWQYDRRWPASASCDD